jgi:hypothetical protein
VGSRGRINTSNSFYLSKRVCLTEDNRKLSKRVENRTWPTRYRGACLVHASLRRDDITSDEIEHRFGVRLSDELLFGGVLGRVAAQ